MTKEEGTIEPLSFRLQRNFASADGDRSSLPGRTRFLPSPSNKLLGYFRDIPPGLIPLGRTEVFSSGHDGPGGLTTPWRQPQTKPDIIEFDMVSHFVEDSSLSADQRFIIQSKRAPHAFRCKGKPIAILHA